MKRQEIVLKAFLVSTSPEKREKLVKHISPSRRDALSSLPDISIDQEEATVSPFDLVHWSWLAPSLESYDETDQRLFLKALHTRIQKPIEKQLGIHSTTEICTPIGAAFLRKTLEESIFEQDLLPPSHLPPSPLNQLLQIEKKKLIRLIDYLSLYDLSCEIKHIVNKKTLNLIYASLTEEERKYLKVATHNKEPYLPLKIPLDNWDGSRETMRHLMQRIGLTRLGSALNGQHPDLIWYVCHLLDSGRGNMLMKLTNTKKMPGVTKWLCEQLRDQLSY